MSERIRWIFVIILAIITGIGIVMFSNPEVEVSGYELHTVQDGETMWAICREYNPDCEYVGELVRFLMSENGKTSSVIYPGEAVIVPIGE